MSTRNPYQPPQSNVGDTTAKKDLGVGGIVVVTLCAFQLILASPNAFFGFEMIRTGEISAFVYVLSLLAFSSLAGGALLLVFGSRAARYAAGISLLPSALLALGLRSNLFMASAFVSVCLLVFTIVHFRVKND